MDKILKRLGNAIFYAVIGFFFGVMPVGCQMKDAPQDEHSALALLIVGGLFALAGFGYGLATDDE